MTDLEQIDNQIMALRRKRIALQKAIPKPHFDLNDIPALKLRASGKRFDTRVKVQPKPFKQNTKVMKSKITLPKEKAERALVAARFASIECGELKQVNPKTVSLVLTHSSPNNLLEMGGFLETITDADVKAAQSEIAAEKKAAEEKAKAAKK